LSRYILRRLGAGIVLLFVTATFSFLLLRMAGGNVGRSIMGVNATNKQVEELNRTLGLRKPLVVQYGVWMRHAVVGDFGKTWKSEAKVPVWSVLRVRVPVTVTIVALSVLVAAALAVLLGITAAVRGGAVDRAVQLVGLIGFAIPGFLLAFGLITLFAVRWHIFQAVGYTWPGESFTGWLRSVTLPVVSLSFATLASLALQVRGAIRDGLGLDYVRTLRSRGLSSRRTVFKHVLRNASGPALAVVNTQFIGLLGGAVIVEGIFSLPGLGPATLQAAVQGDVPVVMAVVVITGVLVVLVNLLIDLLTAWLNPKVRLT
jgi:peptide/nickel transport system permease protein